jgi:hypothetical protein
MKYPIMLITYRFICTLKANNNPMMAALHTNQIGYFQETFFGVRKENFLRLSFKSGAIIITMSTYNGIFRIIQRDCHMYGIRTLTFVRQCVALARYVT